MQNAHSHASTHSPTSSPPLSHTDTDTHAHTHTHTHTHSFQGSSSDMSAFDPDRSEEEQEGEVYGNLQNMIEETSEDVYQGLMYSENESIYSALGDDKRSNVVRVA